MDKTVIYFLNMAQNIWRRPHFHIVCGFFHSQVVLVLAGKYDVNVAPAF